MTEEFTRSVSRRRTAVAEDARAVVVDIAYALENQPRSNDYGGSLAIGAAGEAVFFANLCRVSGGAPYKEAAEQRLRAAAQWIQRQPRVPTLYQGFVGVAWAISHTYRCLDLPIAAGVFDEIDNAVLRFLKQETSAWLKFELMEGLAGLAVYCVERLPDPIALESLHLIVRHLEQLAEKQSSGLFWRTPADTLGFDSARFPRGHVNLGIAHGVTGVIAALVRIAEHTGDSTGARTLAAQAINWLLTQRAAVAAPSRLPAYFDPDVSSARDSARLAWCYGDPGVAAVLLPAANLLNHPNWKVAALQLAESAIRLPKKQHQPMDAAICHGAAGLGHIYHRLYQQTGVATYQRASLEWFSLCLSMRRKSSFGVGGFAALLPESNQANARWFWAPERGLLRGAAGIGLALLDLHWARPSGWDAVLGLS